MSERAAQFLVRSPAQRMQRSAAKQHQLLRFLRDEIFTTPPLVGRLVRLNSRQAVHSLTTRMAKQNLIAVHRLALPGGPATLIGITPHGQAMAFAPESEEPVRVHFDPRRVAPITLQHTLDLQTLRITATAAGWSDWTNGNRLGTLGKDAKRPDAIARAPSGATVALELERTFKTPKRYEAILVSYLRAFKAKTYDAAVWISPDDGASARLRRMFLSITSVRVASRSFAIDPAAHQSKLFFAPASAWPAITATHSAFPAAAPVLHAAQPRSDRRR